MIGLTKREKEVVKNLAYGHTNNEIAQNLHISVRTVETHRENIRRKLGIKSRAQIVTVAMDNGLFNPA